MCFNSLALIKSPPLSFNTLTAFARVQLTCCITRSISFGSTPDSSTGPSSSGASRSGISSSSSSKSAPDCSRLGTAFPPDASCCAAESCACEFMSSIYKMQKKLRMHLAKRYQRPLSPWLHQKRCNSHCLATCTPQELPVQREPIGEGLACAGLPALNTRFLVSSMSHG